MSHVLEPETVELPEAAPSPAVVRRPRRRRLGRAIVIITAGAVVVGASVAAALGFGGSDGGTPSRGTMPPATAQVTRATLVDYEEFDGELAYGDPQPLKLTASNNNGQQNGGNQPADTGQNVITWLPDVGSTVDRGKPVCKVDNKPVVLLYGALPLYRTLTAGVKGPDVKQLEQNLKALGYGGGFTVDEEFTSATANAVKDWQKNLGLTETGTVVPGQVIYATGAIRVAEQKLRVGDPASGEVVTYTGTTRLVTLNLDVNRQRLATKGAKAMVTLPDGKTVEGTVASVGAVATSDNNNGNGGQQNNPTVKVIVSVADQNALGALQQTPVKVKFVAEERKDVLTVPVAALLALAEGGYGIQVVEGSSTRILAVETGMFANGRVEVRGARLQQGMTVGMPK